MSKFIDRIIWNKRTVDENNEEVIHEYDLSTTADKVFIEQEKHFTVFDFFSWVKNFFEEGAFFIFDRKEPQSLQTKIWIDTTPYFMSLPASSTIVDIENLTQTITTDDTFEIPFAVEKGIESSIVSIASTSNAYVKWEDVDDLVIIYGTGTSSSSSTYTIDSEYIITYKDESVEPEPESDSGEPSNEELNG